MRSSVVPRLPPRILETRVPWTRLSPEQLTYLPCPLCGSFQFETRASLVINWTEFFIVQCVACRLTWRNPMPDNAFLHDLYSEQYFDVRRFPPDLVDQVGIPDTTVRDRLMRRKKSKSEVGRWKRLKILPADAKGRPRKLLEIGGGRGYLQRAARDAGWDTLGLEISPHGVKEAINRGLSIVPVVLDELCDQYLPYPKYFDVIVFFDFLEHVVDPGRVLRLVHSILKDDGIIILRVPCIEESELPKFHLVDHIFHFSDRTIRLMLERQGFATMQHSHPSGKFPGKDGQVQNMTYYAKKRKTRGVRK